MSTPAHLWLEDEGRRSAWSKPGGYSPLCCPDDVSKEQVKAWRERQKP